MKKLLLKFLFVLALSSNSLMAKQMKLVSVYNTDEKTTVDLYIVLNQYDSAIGLKLHDLETGKWKKFNTKDLKKGALIKEVDGHDVVLLKSNDFEVDRGGNFKLDYLYNAITGKRKNFPLELDYNGTKWTCLHEGEDVAQLLVNENKVLGKTIGIKKISPKSK